LNRTLTQISHETVAASLGGDSFLYALDATLGRGRDALFAASMLAEGGKVFGFDIQGDAVSESERLFAENGLSQKAMFFHAGHESMLEFLPPECIGKISCAFFNLGWLPCSDKKISTSPASTLRALEAVLKVLDMSRAVLSVLSYRGHDGGAQEYAEVSRFFRENLAGRFETFGDEANAASPILFAARFGKCARACAQ